MSTIICLLVGIFGGLNFDASWQGIFGFTWMLCILVNSTLAIFYLRQRALLRVLIGAFAYATIPMAFGCFSTVFIFAFGIVGAVYMWSAEFLLITLEALYSSSNIDARQQNTGSMEQLLLFASAAFKIVLFQRAQNGAAYPLYSVQISE
ncbi:hypothetical protein [Neisseria canis]|uniref:hypothetical protein n=1 Tax=Neisseria canis TaxID=493 RepID=UPI000F844112|nr:hypothetical protein [Neisseria canis]